MNALWAYVREQIITQPKFVALKTGIEQLAWLRDLVEPEPSPTLRAVGDEYFNRPDLSEKEANSCRRTWSDFARSVGVATLRELKPELVAQWGANGMKSDT
ncbi:MAG TPA: hypothetical protein VF624_08930, partial [Tepidisphaeraceae bacterium]